MAESSHTEHEEDTTSWKREFLKSFVDSKALHGKLDKWLEERFSVTGDGQCMIEEPFKLEELRLFDYALDGSSFLQGSRMPSVAGGDSSSLLTEASLAIEDFLYSASQGLWNMFWKDEDNDSFPFFVAGTHELNKPYHGPHCAALVAKCEGTAAHVPWEHIFEIVLPGDDQEATHYGSHPALDQVSRAIFYALHILVSRRIAHIGSATMAFILVINSDGGGVIKVKGDVDQLETNTTYVYESAAAWVQQHTELEVSLVNNVWTKFGGVNWKDVGALQLLLATYRCMEQFEPPKRCMSEMASQHSFRLLQRAQERHLEGNVSYSDSSFTPVVRSGTEIVEIEEVDENLTEVPTSPKIESGTVLWLDDSLGQKGFEVQEDLSDDRHFIYSAFALEDEEKMLLNVYIGAHPARLEPSWEDMNSWYQVQRQARILNVMRQRGLSSKYIPEFVHLGKLLHPGTCVKQSLKGRCDHPWCGLPVLVTSPVGESLRKIFARDGVLLPTQLLECCHDCLSALQSAHVTGIQHANITPSHIQRVTGANGEKYYVLVEWGHAILEEKDRPGTSLSFSSTNALQGDHIFPVSDIESLIYVLFYLCGGILPQFDSVESALQWRVRAWARRAFQQVLGEASIVLKAFADYVDNLCGTPYAVAYGIWLSRLNRALGREDTGFT